LRRAGWALALGGLAWVFHDVDLAVIASGFRGLDRPLAGIAVAVDLAAFLCQGWRWRLLLRPRGRISLVETTKAVYAGLFTNEILPFRVGELVRSYLVARRLGIDIMTVLASVAVERLFDGVWLALSVGLVAIFVPLPPDLTRAADLLGAVVLVAALGFAWLVLRRGRPVPVRTGFLGQTLQRAAAAVRTLGSTRTAVVAFAISSGVLGFQILAFWLMLDAYGIQVPLLQGAVVLLVVALGTALPNAPGNVGTYQLFCVLALGLFGVEKSVATGFSVVAFVVLTIPIWLLGAVALSASGESLLRIRGEVAEALRASRARRRQR
jgi:uncharacterized membrane protein YbhN (UPF0104 family)